MLPIQRRTLLVDYAVGLALVNFFINAAIAWLFQIGNSSVSLFGGGLRSVALDIAITCFLLPFLTCMIATSLTRKKIRSGKLPALQQTPQDLGTLGKLPDRARMRGVALGLICLAIVAPLTIYIMRSLSIDVMTIPQYVVFKGIFAAALSLLIGPTIGIWAMLAPRPA